MDIYLQPHSDDICFSLGSLAHKRQRGILLTIFPVSAYVPLLPGTVSPGPEMVTKIRVAEDRAFAEACGLEMRCLDLQCASLLGHHPFDLRSLEQNERRVARPILEALRSISVGQETDHRSWLFCPSGIGGHIDHLATLLTISRNYPQLKSLYRVAFYEDLHYASNAIARSAGLARLSRAMSGRRLYRCVFPLGANAQRKLELIRLYRSQFLALPQSLDQFTPAVESAVGPHEAIWTEEPAMLQV